jgi:hypothetical protein
MKYDKTLMQIIEESVIELTDSGQTVFTRMDIYNQAQKKYPDIKKMFIRPNYSGYDNRFKGRWNGFDCKEYI